MNTTQVNVIKRYISVFKGMSNNKLSKLIVDKSNTFKGYSAGSVANYIGKVKNLETKIVNTESGSLLQKSDIMETKDFIQNHCEKVVENVIENSSLKPEFDYLKEYCEIVIVSNTHNNFDYILPAYLNNPSVIGLNRIVILASDQPTILAELAPGEEYKDVNISDIEYLSTYSNKLFSSLNIAAQKSFSSKPGRCNTTILTSKCDVGSSLNSIDSLSENILAGVNLFSIDIFGQEFNDLVNQLKLNFKNCLCLTDNEDLIVAELLNKRDLINNLLKN